MRRLAFVLLLLPFITLAQTPDHPPERLNAADSVNGLMEMVDQCVSREKQNLTIIAHLSADRQRLLAELAHVQGQLQDLQASSGAPAAGK